MRSNVEFQLTGLTSSAVGTTSANDVLFVWRNPLLLADGSNNPRGQKISKIAARLHTIAGPTAQQEVALALHKVTAMTANFTGGTDLSHPTTTANKGYRVLGPDPARVGLLSGQDQKTVLQAGNVQISNAAISSAGSPVVETFPFAWDAVTEPVTATAVVRSGVNLVWTPSAEGSDDERGLVLKPDTGFVLRTPVALGAGYSGRLFVQVFWCEQ